MPNGNNKNSNVAKGDNVGTNGDVSDLTGVGGGANNVKTEIQSVTAQPLVNQKQVDSNNNTEVENNPNNAITGIDNRDTSPDSLVSETNNQSYVKEQSSIST